MKKNIYFFSAFCFISIFLAFFTQPVLANPQAEIWDADTSSWTTTFADGDFIDKVGTESWSTVPQMAVDGNGVVYVAYEQVLSDGLSNHILLSRYNGTRAEIWDADTRTWVADFSLGDPIDTGLARDAANAQIAIDSNNKVYVTYYQTDGSDNRVYLTRYDSTNGVQIWNSDAPAGFTSTMGTGDPVDGGAIFSAGAPQIIIDSTNKVYVAYTQNNGASLYLSRYNGTDVRIWDNDTANWVTDLALGDPIDNALGTGVGSYQLAKDSSNNIYAVYSRSSGAKTHIYLSRYNAVAAWTEVWDNGTPGWSTTFASGDPIDTGLANNATTPQIAVDASNNVYVVYVQSTGTKNHIFLSRYNGTDVRIWDNGGTAWTNVFANGDPIDFGSNFNFSSSPQLVIDSTGKVYITYNQLNGLQKSIYLSRYNGTNVEIWDSVGSAWTTTFTNGGPIDAVTGGDAFEPDIARDSEDNIYITFRQFVGANSHVYLSRYDGTDVRISYDGLYTWTDTFANGDPIDTGTANDAYNPQIVTDIYDNAYITYRQNSGTKYRTYLSRFYVMMPTISNQGGNNQGTSTLTINGRIEKVGAENVTSRGFEYGLDGDYGNVFSESGSYSAGDFFHEITGLPLNTLYYFRAFAGNSFGMSSSTIGTVSSMANPPLNPVVTSVSRSTVSFSWEDNSNPNWTNYAIYNVTADATSTPATGLTTTLTGLTCGTAYDFEVRSINQDDRSSIGAAVSTSTSACPGASDPQVQIWDDNTNSWTTTFTAGDPVDTGLGFGAGAPQLATDSDSNVYITYSQSDGDYLDRIYLSRYNGTTIEIWDNGTSAWVTDLSLGDPIDAGNGESYYDPQIAIDSTGKVYVTYTNDSDGHVYLSRYNGTDVEIWNNDAPAGWTTTFTSGDPIDNPAGPWGEFPQIAIDSNNKVYVTYSQVAGDDKYHIYLSRYDGEGVKIWATTTASWVTDFSLAGPIDTGLAYDAYRPQLAIATSTDYAYITYSQGDIDGNSHIYLSRYDSTNGVQIWNSDAPDGWTTNLALGDPIDNPNNLEGEIPQIATDSTGDVYVTYHDDDNNRIYLSRYNGTNVEIWATTTASWVTNLTLGGPIDNPSGDWSDHPQIAIDSSNKVYVTFEQIGTDSYRHVYLSRYNGTNVEIWATTTASWVTDPTLSGPVDKGTSFSSGYPQVTTDSDNNVYITYVQDDGSRDRLYLSRYDGTSVKIWDTGSFSWTATLADGGTIDNGTDNSVWYPQITAAINKNIYMAYQQSASGDDQIYLSRYFPGEPVVEPVITLPVVTVSTASSISTTTATLNGNITDTGGENNTVRGFEYGATLAYGLSTSTTGDYDAGVFSLNISGLTASTTYHFRTFATNSAGTATSTDETFVTLASEEISEPEPEPEPEIVEESSHSVTSGTHLGCKDPKALNYEQFVASRPSLCKYPPTTFALVAPATNPHFTNTLNRGTESPEVLALQTRLATLGFLTATPNGFFGPATEAAVRAFQTANNLPPVGIVGPLTRALLNEIPATPGNSSVSTPRQLVELLIAIGVIAPEMAERARGAVGN